MEEGDWVGRGFFCSASAVGSAKVLLLLPQHSTVRHNRETISNNSMEMTIGMNDGQAAFIG